MSEQSLSPETSSDDATSASVALPAPRRGQDLELRVTAPTTGADLPVVVMAHGFGLSKDAYDPLVDYWAAHGFVVVQPTFLDSMTLGLGPDDPRYPDIWRIRIDDLDQVINELDAILDSVPGLSDRTDRGRLAIAGHSWGGQSVGMLLGARVVDAQGSPGGNRADNRIKAGVLLSTAGTGGENLSAFAQENFSFMSPDFEEVTVPTLVIAGDNDQSPLTTRGPDWFTDAYTVSPGAKNLVTVFGGEHSLGGVQGYNAPDSTDESPERVDLVRQTSTAFLKTALGIDATAWDDIAASVAASPRPAGRIDSKQS